MPSNIEIKARVRDFNGIRQRAESLSDTPLQIIHQEDTFFNTEKGRLKLRVFTSDRAQLIYYLRSDQQGPKRSDYHIFETPDPENLKRVLELAYGIRGVVKKTRYLYVIGQTRVHLDDVEDLGQFMELEVVLQKGESNVDGEVIAKNLMTSLGVESSDLLEGAYMDLIQSVSTNPRESSKKIRGD